MARDNFISLHGSEGELVDDRLNTYKVELQSWYLEQGASVPKPGCVSSLVGLCLGQVVLRSFTARMRKLQVAGLAPWPKMKFLVSILILHHQGCHGSLGKLPTPKWSSASWVCQGDAGAGQKWARAKDASGRGDGNVQT